MDAVTDSPVPDVVARALDITVALEAGGYRWVQWNRTALGDAPLYQPGQFLAHPDDLLAPHHKLADPDQDLAEEAFARLPRYSASADLAVQVADATGLFSEGGAILRRARLGGWVVEIRHLGATVCGDTVAEALCVAVLRWVRRP